VTPPFAGPGADGIWMPAPAVGSRARRCLGLGFVRAGSVPRRRVVHTNLRLCFPHCSAPVFAPPDPPKPLCDLPRPGWTGAGWWHAPSEVTLARSRPVGASDELAARHPPCDVRARISSAWTPAGPPDAAAPTKVHHGVLPRKRRPGGGCLDSAGPEALPERPLTIRPGATASSRALQAPRAGEPLCRPPDMNYGRPRILAFVPFDGVRAATAPSLSRVARMGRAEVIAMVSRITPQGYEVEITPRWSDFPSADVVADTATMNVRLQSDIDRDPAQYYWVHKRFKDRPEGEPAPYEGLFTPCEQALGCGWRARDFSHGRGQRTGSRVGPLPEQFCHLANPRALGR